jgi:hypothetical protein
MEVCLLGFFLQPLFVLLFELLAGLQQQIMPE